MYKARARRNGYRMFISVYILCEWLLHLYICFYLNVAFKTFKMYYVQYVQFLCQYMIPKPINQSIKFSRKEKFRYDLLIQIPKRQSRLQQTTHFATSFLHVIYEINKACYFVRIYCWQTIFMKYSLFVIFLKSSNI